MNWITASEALQLDGLNKKVMSLVRYKKHTIDRRLIIIKLALDRSCCAKGVFTTN